MPRAWSEPGLQEQDQGLHVDGAAKANAVVPWQHFDALRRQQPGKSPAEPEMQDAVSVIAWPCDREKEKRDYCRSGDRGPC